MASKKKTGSKRPAGKKPAANSNGSNGKHEQVDRELPCKLTEHELLQRGEQMAACETEIDKLKDDRSVITKAINAKAALRGDLADVIESGEEKRKVRCHWVEDLKANCKTLVRQDTGDVVDTVALTAADRQEDIFGGDETEERDELEV